MNVFTLVICLCSSRYQFKNQLISVASSSPAGRKQTTDKCPFNNNLQITQKASRFPAFGPQHANTNTETQRPRTPLALGE